MSPFEFVSVIISVVIGLGLTHLLTGLVGLVQRGRQVRFYWLHLLWLALLFVSQVFLWWSLWTLQEVRSWTFFSFLLFLLLPVTLYVAAALLIPDAHGEPSPDLRAHYYQVHRAVFGTLAAFTVLLVLYNALLEGRFRVDVTMLLLGGLLALELGAAASKSPRFHALVGIAFTALFTSMIALFGIQIR
ncbi:MAG TPA: hypothetical protein VHG51_08165 [Longimicrobiaceae bacterium]|nr:hypothetical protein [Longimicrobiaceae bacterium]